MASSITRSPPATLRTVLSNSLRAAVATGLALTLCPGMGMGQAPYPAKPVVLVVPYTPGGPNDDEFRLFLPRLQENTRQSFVFDFKPGASSIIGTTYVAKAAPDGYPRASRVVRGQFVVRKPRKKPPQRNLRLQFRLVIFRTLVDAAGEGEGEVAVGAADDIQALGV